MDTIFVGQSPQFRQCFALAGGGGDNGGKVSLADSTGHRRIHEGVERRVAEPIEHRCLGGTRRANVS